MTVPLLPTRITAVTVFAEGALVTRSASLDGLDGRPARLRVAGLPLCLDDASLRARVVGASALAVDVAVTLDAESAVVDSAGLEADLHAAVAEERRLDARLALARQQIAALAELDVDERPFSPRGTPPPPSPTASRLALIGFQRAEAARLHGEQAALEEAAREHRERLAVLRDRLAQASAQRPARPDELRKAALIDLRWQGAPGGELHLDYLVPGARWRPTYAVRFDADLAHAEIAVRAAVAQRSGEDWTGVVLTLSSAAALAWYDLPELTSLRIGRRQPRPARTGWRPPPDGADALFADYLRAWPDAADAQDRFTGARSETTRGAGPGEQALLASAAAAALPVGGVAVGGAARFARRASPEDLENELLAEPEADDETRFAMRLQAPSPGAPAVRSRRMMVKAAAAPAAAEPPPPPPPDPTPARDLLAYRRLRMPAPHERGRGRLQAVDDVLLWMASETRISVTVTNEIAVAVRAAHTLADEGVPHGSQPVAAGAWAASWPVEGAMTVPADGGWHQVPLGTRPIEAALVHVVVPRESRDVFRICRLVNPFTQPLLPGPVEVSRDGRFLIAARIPETAPEGRCELGLGVEPAIAVARNARFAEESAGLLGGSLALVHEVRIDLANKLGRAVAVEVRERLPVPATGADDCTVKLRAVAPAWEEYVPDGAPVAGAQRWRLQLAAGQAQQLAFTYAVTIPARSEVVGGNRRE